MRQGDSVSEHGAGRYSVFVWNMHNDFEHVVRHVSDREALSAAHQAIITIGAQLGLTKRIVIADEKNTVMLDWRYPGEFVKPRLRP